MKGYFLNLDLSIEGADWPALHAGVHYPERCATSLRVADNMEVKSRGNIELIKPMICYEPQDQNEIHSTRINRIDNFVLHGEQE